MFAMLIAIVLGVLFGVISAVFRNKPADQILRGVSVSGVSIPSFWFALLVLYVFSSVLGWFPSGGRLDPRAGAVTGGTGLYVLDGLLSGNFSMVGDALSHLLLPALVLGFFTMGLITRQTRSNLLETISTDYIRTARAKGMSERRVITHHALGNALSRSSPWRGWGSATCWAAWCSWRKSSPGRASGSTRICRPPPWIFRPYAACRC